MSAWDDFVQGYAGDAPAPTEELPDDIPDMDTDYTAKHKRAAVYYPIVDRFAKEHPDVPDLASYAKAMMLRESGGNPMATSSANARGLLQLIPRTYEDMGGDPQNAYDPEDNIKRGVDYIAQQYRDYGDWKSALAAYNWGPGNVDRYGTATLPHETANYVKAVNAYRKRLKPSGFEFYTEDGAPSAPASIAPPEPWSQFLQAYNQDAPSLEGFKSGPIDLNQPQPVANGLPALQPAKTVSGVEPPPPEQTPIPFTQLPPRMGQYQAPQGGLLSPQTISASQVQGNTQLARPNAVESEIPAPVQSAIDPFKGFTQGVAGAVTASAYQPPPAENWRQSVTQFLGDLVGQAAVQIPPFLLGPEVGLPAAGGYQMLRSGNAQKNANPNRPVDVAQAGAQGGLGAVMAGAAPSFGKDILIRVLTGAGIGMTQGIAASTVDQMAEQGKINLNDPNTWKSALMGAGMGAIFGAAHQPGVPKPGPEAYRGEGVPITEGMVSRYTQENPNANFPPQAPTPPAPPATPTRADALSDAAWQAKGEGVYNSVNDEQLKAFEGTLGKAVDAALQKQGAKLRYEVENPAPDQMATEPYQMTRAKYEALNEALGPEVAKTATPHIDLVKEAVAQGKEVPPEVMAEYPHLAPSETVSDQDHVIHVGEYVRKALLGDDGRTFRLNPKDMNRLGLYEGQITNPDAMAQSSIARTLGGFIKVDPNAPTLEQIAHYLNKRILVHETAQDTHVDPKYRFLGADKPADNYGFNADDMATALLNRPRSREALKEEVGKAAGVESRLGDYDASAMEAFYRLPPEERAKHEAEMAAARQNEPAPTEDEGLPYYQKEDQKPVFYSQLDRIVNDKMPNAMGPEALKNMLKANGVKDEEIKWTGLDDYLKGKEKVTKKEIQDHLDQNQVEVKEVHKADLTRRDPGGEKAFAEEDDNGEWRVYGEAANEGDVYQTEAEAKRKAAEYNREIPTSPVKYNDYQEPGGKNYRELLLTLPQKGEELPQGYRIERFQGGWSVFGPRGEEGSGQTRGEALASFARRNGGKNYRSSHWDEPNVLAHVRFNDRVTPEGKKVLHLEEIQSDWHQQGRKYGYKENAPKPTGWEATGQIGTGVGVPDAPFKKTWHEMALRRMLRYAAENGYDYLTWTGGEKQAARYDLSKHLDSISAKKLDDGRWDLIARNTDKRIVHHDTHAESELPDVVGKEMAQKIIDRGGGQFENLDLKVGGEGMKGFYDKIVPDYLNKYAKKWGARIQEVKAAYEGSSIRAHDQAFQGISITPEMKASVMEGQPLFQQHRGSFRYDSKTGEYVISLVKGKANLSTLFHEHFHLLEQMGAIGKEDRAKLAEILEQQGFKDPINKKTGAFKAPAAEKLADWFERYLRDGVTQIEGLKPIFEKIKTWMRQIYQSIKGTRLEDAVPGDVRDIYDRMLNRDKLGARPRPKDVAEAQDQIFKQSEEGPQVGPNSKLRKERFEKSTTADKTTLENVVNWKAKKQGVKSGFLTDKEIKYTERFNEAEPLEKIQRFAENALGRKLKPSESIKLAINRVLGSGGRANLRIKKELYPIINGGVRDGIKYEKLTPDEVRLVAAYALARDARWRYSFAEGYEQSALTREHAEQLLRYHAKLDPNTKFKVEQAAQGLVTYAKDLARSKMEAKLPAWAPDKFARITANPFYIPEIRDWESVQAKPMGMGKKRLFTSTNRLVRSNKDTGEIVPIFDPITSLVHDTHEFEAEAAKMAVWNNVLELANQIPSLRDWIKKKPKDYTTQNFEGEVSVLRPRETHLEVPQMEMAEQYEKAQHFLEQEKQRARDKAWMEEHAIRVWERINKMPMDRRQMFGEDFDQILKDVQARYEKWVEKKKKESEAVVAKFQKLPEPERNLIEDYIEEGKPQTYIVPKEVADSVNGMGHIEYAALEKYIVKVASFFRSMQVGKNFDFSGANIPRDAQEALFNAKMPPWYWLKGLAHVLKKDKVYEAYLNEGGAMEGDESGMGRAHNISQEVIYGDRFFRDRYAKVRDAAPWKEQRHVKLFGREMPYSGQVARVGEAIKQTAMTPFDAAEILGEAGELATRLGVVDYGKKKGLSEAEAVALAREATLDFKRIGSKMKNWNARIPFLNARIQGIDRLRRTWKEDPKGAAMRLLLYSAAPAAALQAWNSLNPNYKDIPAWEKEYYWIIMDPSGPGYTKFAKGSHVQLLLNPIQMWYENLAGTADVSAWHILQSTLESGAPVSDVHSLFSPAEKLVAEEMAGPGGYDFYSQRPVVRQPGKEAQDQWDPNTPETLRKLGRVLKLSPERMQHVLRTLMGGTAGNILFLTDLLQGKKPKDVGSTPFVRRFRGKAEGWKSDVEEKTRVLQRQLSQKKDALKAYKMDMMRVSKTAPDSATAANDRAQLKEGMRRTMKATVDLMRQLGEAREVADSLQKSIDSLNTAP